MIVRCTNTFQIELMLVLKSFLLLWDSLLLPALWISYIYHHLKKYTTVTTSYNPLSSLIHMSASAWLWLISITLRASEYVLCQNKTDYLISQTIKTFQIVSVCVTNLEPPIICTSSTLVSPERYELPSFAPHGSNAVNSA